MLQRFSLPYLATAIALCLVPLVDAARSAEPSAQQPTNELEFGNLLGEDTPAKASPGPVVREAVVTGTETYNPEYADSFELGLKSEYAQGRVRSNLTLFHTNDTHSYFLPRPAVWRDDGKMVGGVWLVARRGRVVHFDAVGHADVEADKPMAKDAIFRIYSMSKPIVSVAAMTLVEEGRLRLEEPLSTYIPFFAASKNSSLNSPRVCGVSGNALTMTSASMRVS